MNPTSNDFNESIRAYVRKQLLAALGIATEEENQASIEDSIIEGQHPSLEDRIDAMLEQANKGCGQIYELFAERFSGMLDKAFPPGSIDRERAIALSGGVYETPEEIEESQNESAEMGYCSHGLDPDCCPCGCGEL